MASGWVKLTVVSSAIKAPENELQLVFPLNFFPVTSKVMVGFVAGYKPLKAIMGAGM
jgi:hypothetical protein